MKCKNGKRSEVPRPHVMPVDSADWKRRLSLSNFINAYYAYRDISNLSQGGRVLIIGPGQGLDTAILKWREYDVTTLDIDSTFDPDFVASAHEMGMFGDAQFDVVAVSHVLEHIPVPFLDKTLLEISRVGRYALVYLPVAGRHSQIRWKAGFGGIDWSMIFDLFNYLHKPDGITPRYCSGQHYWELGMRGYRKSDLKKRFEHSFEILSTYRNRDWNPSFNFILKSKRHP